MSGFLLSKFFLLSDTEVLLIDGSYNRGMVVVSIVIAMMASMLAMQLAGVAQLRNGSLNRHLALGSGAVVLGAGVWTMHFIGMLAYNLCSVASYDTLITVLSMLPAFLAAWVALNLLSRASASAWQLATGGILVGAGIGVMHYSGMSAIHRTMEVRFDPGMFVLSILLAVLLSTLALWLRFGLNSRNLLSPRWRTLLAGAVLGMAISGMHYTGMAAAHFVVMDESYEPQSNTALALTVTIVTLLTILIAATVNAVAHYRRVYRRIEQSEERLRTIVDTAVDGIISIGRDGIVSAMNPAAERIFGWSAGEVIGRNVNMLMPEPDRSGHDGYLSNYLSTGQAKIIGTGRDVTGLHRSGRTFPMRLAIGKAELADELLFIGFVTDNSQSNAMERALRESERKYRSIVDNLPGVAFRCRLDAQWSMLFISEAVEALTGWTDKDFIDGAIDFNRIMHADDRERINGVVMHALQLDQPYLIEFCITRRDGSERWVSERGTGVRNEQGEIIWIDGIIIDNTEAKLRNAEFESVVDAIGRSFAMAEFTLDGVILNANENFLSLMGYSREEMLGRHHSFLCSEEEKRSEAYRALWSELRQGHFRAGEFRRIGKGGKTVWTQGYYSPILDPDGKPYKVIKFASDLSERQAMEQRLREAKATAEQAAAAKGIFLANMSHEIRTPMNAIIGFTDVLLGEFIDERQRRHLKIVRNSARSLLGLLNDILDTAKLERGAVELEIADFSLRELCMQVLASLRITAQRKGLELRLEYPEAVPDFFKGDGLRLQQVLLNLLGNAIKFTEQGHVVLRVELDQEQVHIVVSDTGIGIAEDRQQRIFDPFSQADVSMTRRFGGTGLGTTIARQLVELMQGRITVDSVLGQGSNFHVYVPLPLGEAVSGYEETRHIELPPLRVLVADDVPQNLELLQLALGKAGHTIIAAVDGVEAVERFMSDRFDIVLMDVQMPRLNGLEATRRIREFELAQQRERTPIVALTASVLDEDRMEAFESGMDGFASKPVELDKLNLEIARLLNIDIPMPAAPAAAMPVVQGSVIDWMRGRRLWGNEERHRQAIVAFLAGHGDGGAMRNQLAVAPEVLGAELHRLRGAAGNLALTRVTTLAGNLETALGEGMEATLLASLLDRLIEELGNVADVLEQIERVGRGTAEDAAPLVGDRLQLLAALDKLDAGLARGELLDDAYRMLSTTLPKNLVRPLQDAIDAFDFDNARAALTRLRERLANDEVPT